MEQEWRMLRWHLFATSLIVYTGFSQIGWAQKRTRCSQSQNLRAEREAGSLRNWDDLYRSFKLYGKCDNVDAAEGYSESVARILVDQWGTLPRFATLAANDKTFQRFVFASVNATLDMKDVNAIRKSSVEACPSGLKKICSGLSERAEAAIAEDAYHHRKK